MAKTTHTGRGTCQVCGALQAIDNVTGITAKHGYKVAGYHFFVGVCPGAAYLPAQKDLTITHKIIGDLTAQALAHDVMAERLLKFEVVTEGETDVVKFAPDAAKLASFQEWDYNLPVVRKDRWGRENKSRGGYVTVEVTADTPAYVIEREQTRAAKVEEVNARHARSHITMMLTHIVPKFGTALEPAKDVAKVERAAAKAKALEGVQFPTKQSRKDALDKLSRAFDRARDELQDMYLALPDAQRTEAKTAIYYGPMQLSHWRPKHAEAALREFPKAANIVERINALVAQREAIKTAE